MNVCFYSVIYIVYAEYCFYLSVFRALNGPGPPAGGPHKLAQAPINFTLGACWARRNDGHVSEYVAFVATTQPVTL